MAAVPSQGSFGWLLFDVSVSFIKDLHAASGSGDEFHVDTYCSFVVFVVVFSCFKLIGNSSKPLLPEPKYSWFYLLSKDLCVSPTDRFIVWKSWSLEKYAYFKFILLRIKNK